MNCLHTEFLGHTVTAKTGKMLRLLCLQANISLHTDVIFNVNISNESHASWLSVGSYCIKNGQIFGELWAVKDRHSILPVLARIVAKM